MNRRETAMSTWTGSEDPATLDQHDPLARFRGEFYFPEAPGGGDEIYLCGNSLGLQPRRAEAHLTELLSSWRGRGVRGHFEGPNPWMPYHEFLTADLAALVGARPREVVAMNSLTVNLHLLLASFYRPTRQRYKILIEAQAFPSDHYAAVSQLQHHGVSPEDGLLLWKPSPRTGLLELDELRALLAQHGDSLALVLVPGVHYYTGQALDLEAITRLGHAAGAVVGVDLAHAVGNLDLALHDWGPDFACWCSYKYLNGGPGAIAGAFVHERHAEAGVPRFAGWWGHDKETRFRMGPDFVPIPGAEGWQLSNPPIFSLAPVRASLEVFREAGFMKPLRQKSEALTGYLEGRLLSRLGEVVEILTPRDPRARGCQLSLRIPGGKAVFQRLTDAGVACDWREPDVIRVAPTPLYNSFMDVARFVDILAQSLHR